MGPVGEIGRTYTVHVEFDSIEATETMEFDRPGGPMIEYWQDSLEVAWTPID